MPHVWTPVRAHLVLDKLIIISSFLRYFGRMWNLVRTFMTLSLVNEVDGVWRRCDRV